MTKTDVQALRDAAAKAPIYPLSVPQLLCEAADAIEELERKIEAAREALS